MPLEFDLPDLNVRQTRHQFGIPINQPLVFVDQPRSVEHDKHFAHRAGQSLIESEALPRPVARRAKTLKLTNDGTAGLVLPLPNTLDEAIASELASTGLLMFHQLSFDHDLRGYTGMIGPWLPENVAATHALEPHQDVLKGVIEGVPDVQRSGDVGRRNHDEIRTCVTPFGAPRPKGVRGLPGGIDSSLHLGWLIGLIDHSLGLSEKR